MLSIFFGLYLLVITAASFFMVAEDKKMARQKAVKDKRYSEGLFFLFALLGGTLGVYAGMFLFRHKNRKTTFVLGMPILLFQQLLLVYLLLPFLQ